ncbi:hypothetical protein DYY66_1586 [Candidatus Nitrosotalea sp. FS]|nr:hypothetical protein [Candidatus Nitrosotalea sp. FS]
MNCTFASPDKCSNIIRSNSSGTKGGSLVALDMSFGNIISH